MDKNALQTKWQEAFNAEIQKRMWDAKAERYGKRPVPSPETDFFLLQLISGTGACLPEDKLLLGGRFLSDCGQHADAAKERQNAVLSNSVQAHFAEEMKNWSVLDVGCGAGLYSIGLAPYVKKVAGIDISEKMIDSAKEKAKQEHCGNCEFLCLDWAEADLGRLGFEKAFDMVFVHMSPAVHSYATFDKLVNAAIKRCVFAVNTRRTDMILDRALEYAGIRGMQAHRDRQVPYIFEYLWENGFCPQVRYEKEKWQSPYTAEEMTAWCLDRARLHTALSSEQEKRIAAFVQELAGQCECGVLQEEICVTTVVFDWMINS